jgi:hypothetical protein
MLVWLELLVGPKSVIEVGGTAGEVLDVAEGSLDRSGENPPVSVRLTALPMTSPVLVDSTVFPRPICMASLRHGPAGHCADACGRHTMLKLVPAAAYNINDCRACRGACNSTRPGQQRVALQRLGGRPRTSPRQEVQVVKEAQAETGWAVQVGMEDLLASRLDLVQWLLLWSAAWPAASWPCS